MEEGGSVGANRYEVFLKTTEIGNITKTAEALGYTQSGVSHAINSLEEECGFQLFIRSKFGVRLTEDGRRILPVIQEIVNSREKLRQTIATINGLELGTIRVGAFSSASVNWLPKIIKKFREQHPNIEFQLMNGDYEEVNSWIAAGTIDCGFVTMPGEDGFEVFPLVQDRLLVIVPKDHPFNNAPYFPFEQMAKEAFILPGEGSNYDLGRLLRSSHVKPNVVFSASDDYATIAMVACGLGISVLPELILQGATPEICAVNLEHESYRTIGIAVRAAQAASPATQQFVAFVRRHFAAFNEERVQPSESAG